jgi:hypothetical protein
MSETIIKTTEKLLALRDKNGAIRIDGDLRIECDVLYSVGQNISGIVVSGNAVFGGSADFRGNTDFRGNAYFGGNTYFRGDADIRGNAYFGGNTCFRGDADIRGNTYFGGNTYFRGNTDIRGNADFGGSADFRGNTDFGGNADFGGNTYFRGDRLIIMGDMFWSQAHKPEMPERSYINRVLPPWCQRNHWQDRLGIDISSGCYEDICEVVGNQILNLLKEKKWSATERWMLETLRDSKKQPPEWVSEIVKGERQ